MSLKMFPLPGDSLLVLKFICTSYFKCWPLSPKSPAAGKLLELPHALLLSGSCQFLIFSASPVKQTGFACRSQLIHCMPHKQVGIRLACSVVSASAMESHVVSSPTYSPGPGN